MLSLDISTIFSWLGRLFPAKITIVEDGYENITSPKGSDFHWYRIRATNHSRRLIETCKMIVTSVKYECDKDSRLKELLRDPIELPWYHPNIQFNQEFETELSGNDKKSAYLFKFADNTILQFSRDSVGNGRVQFFDKGIYRVTVDCYGKKTKRAILNLRIIYEKEHRLPKVDVL